MSRLPLISKSPPPSLSKRPCAIARWKVIKPLLPEPKGFGRPRTVDLREILNAVFYVQRSGCQWEMLPHDFPHHGTVYKYFHLLGADRNLEENP